MRIPIGSARTGTRAPKNTAITDAEFTVVQRSDGRLAVKTDTGQYLTGLETICDHAEMLVLAGVLLGGEEPSDPFYNPAYLLDVNESFVQDGLPIMPLATFAAGGVCLLLPQAVQVMNAHAARILGHCALPRAIWWNGNHTFRAVEVWDDEGRCPCILLEKLAGKDAMGHEVWVAADPVAQNNILLALIKEHAEKW